MNEEKMMILKMLQEGKISANEAAKLLESLESGNKQGEKNRLKNRAKEKANFLESQLSTQPQENRERISACRLV